MADGWNEPGVRYRVRSRIDGPPEIDMMSNSDLQSIASSARFLEDRSIRSSGEDYSNYWIIYICTTRLWVLSVYISVDLLYYCLNLYLALPSRTPGSVS